MYRASSIVCAVATCGLLGWAGVLALRPSPAEPAPAEAGESGGLVVENAVQDLGVVPAGEHRVTFRITNPTNRPGEWVGGTTGCQAGRGCCLFFPGQSRMVVRPGETAEITGLLAAGDGPFEFDGWHYLDDGGQLRTVRFKLTGVGVAPEKPHAPPP
jgi:hypothetical protein